MAQSLTGDSERADYAPWYTAGLGLALMGGGAAVTIPARDADTGGGQVVLFLAAGVLLWMGVTCLIAAVVKRYTTNSLRTFSIAFKDSHFDERAYQERMAHHLGTEHTSMECTDADIARVFPDVVRHVAEEVEEELSTLSTTGGSR